MSVATLWVVAGLVLCLAEVISLTFVLLSFGVAAFAAAVVAAFTPGWDWSLAAFAVVSLVCLFALRPMAVRRLHRQPAEGAATNAEALIGRIGTVAVDIPAAGRGRVRVGGEDWSASSGEVLPSGTPVVVEGIEGVTLKVRRQAPRRRSRQA